MVTHHQWGPATINWLQIRKKYHSHQILKWVSKVSFKSNRGQWVTRMLGLRHENYFVTIVPPYSRLSFILLLYIKRVSFYPRPVLAFGYCRSLRLSVRQSVRHQVCPRDNSSPVQARITKFGPLGWKTLVKIPIVFWGDWPWHWRSNLTSKSKFTPLWARQRDNSSPIQAWATKFGPKVLNILV